MKVARIHQWGNVDVVKLEEVGVPTIREDEVLVEVHAAGVNPIDWKIREGYFAEHMQDCFPFAMGWDFAGKIVSLGSDVNKFKNADEVFGLIRFPLQAGTFAHYVAAPADQICLKPKCYDAVHAAAVPLVALTAWQALFDVANLKKNQHVLIHGAGGGVGQYAVQFAKWKGARVSVTGSSSTKALLQSLDVDQFIDYQAELFEEKVKDVDIVIDGIGDEVSLRSLDIMKEGGILIPLPRGAQEAVIQKAKAKNIATPFMIVTPNGAQLESIRHLIDDGLIQTKIEKVFALEEIKSALNLVQEGHCHGKVVLKIM